MHRTASRQFGLATGFSLLMTITLSTMAIVLLAPVAHLAADPAFEARVLAKNMLKRLGTPDDIAWCATWLASNEAGCVTGGDFSIDAGAAG